MPKEVWIDSSFVKGQYEWENDILVLSFSDWIILMLRIKGSDGEIRP